MRKLIILSILCICAFTKLQAQKNRKPNVLVIYTDDHRYSGVHALGGQAVKTPNLDQLAATGIAFTKAFLQGSFSGATCVPSRAMLLTGRNLFELKGRGFTIPNEHTTMGEVFMDAGYHAHHVGKWHQDFESLSRSFNTGDKVCGKPAYLTDQFRMPYSDWHADGKYPIEDVYLLEYDNSNNIIKRAFNKKTDKRGPTATEKVGPHVSKVLADASINFISNYKKKKPFFHYLAFPTPHDPRQAPNKYKNMYPETEIALLPSYMPQHPFDNGHIYLRDELLDVWPRTRQIAKKHLSDYYSIITHLDAQIGRVISALKENGMYENTIIIMAGDSGLAVGNHGLIGKQNIYDEDGIHIPFILSGGLVDKANHGRREDALCYNYDILPTICDMAGIKIPESSSGKSLLPVINNKVENIRYYTYHAYRQHQRAYRKGDYKLIEYVKAPVAKDYAREAHVAGSRVTQLFNITKDPWETFNMADFPKYADIVAQMRKELRLKSKEVGDKPDGESVKVDFWDYYN
ncbi:sulfatase-like hydrolase/transferase [Postechiella marina]|uniref:Sulfatase-like hydrolase/transferase n=1 Tax=Postechiella marina TaxID=943941 RepID=A0ABP8CBW1_9FLAO